jgi:hypothetical protein
MAHGQFQGMDAHHPQIRAMFNRDYLLASDWYRERLRTKQQNDIALWQRYVNYLQEFERDYHNPQLDEKLQLASRYQYAQHRLQTVQSPAYLESLSGTLGTDPSVLYRLE